MCLNTIFENYKIVLQKQTAPQCQPLRGGEVYRGFIWSTPNSILPN